MCDVNNTTLCYTHSLRTTLPFLNVLCHLCSLGAANNPKMSTAQYAQHLKPIVLLMELNQRNLCDWCQSDIESTYHFLFI